ncbi:TAP42-like protein [Kalmanozyma brasiliensis GHG001]|uniref:TAP42-like protein n=1 Tax=Kalmanozyma brasiliensis (strain GHG001) TaxID=1365824 RepID=UPI001CE907B4|nr:TAP42-like protein [Kalmanozyma brasiliensis GHG001]EST07348.2 TAP42-like protein [Kalmanozyma brasiliensis GHG001]
MSGQTLNDLISTVFLQASNPPPAPPPQQFDPRAASSSTASSSSSSTTDPAVATLSLLTRAQQISDSIGVISSNDALRDISTSSLRTLFLPSLAAELHTSVRTGTDHAARKQRLRSSQEAAAKFLNRVIALGVVPPTTKQLVGWTRASVPEGELTDAGVDVSWVGTEAPPHTREVKIATFKLERALKSNLQSFREAYRAKRKFNGIAPDDVVYDLLLYPSQRDDDDEGDDDDGENETSETSAPGGIASVRQYLLALLNLHVLRNASLLASSSQELQLLRSMPPPQPTNPSSTSESEWRLDRPTSGLPTSGPLLAPTGKVLRPFTITPSTRAEVAASVFQPSYRLPTMSIDEYLEEEQRRGNIIQGGGQASYDAPTSTETRQLRAEQDGTLDAEEAEEEQRQKDIHWDRFAEENQKGAGNTMNRG